MAFGISPKVEKTEMIGADAVVSWVDQSTGKGYAVDYYLSAKAQCSGKQGSCPDERIRVSFFFNKLYIFSKMLYILGQDKFNTTLKCSYSKWIFDSYLSKNFKDRR